MPCGLFSRTCDLTLLWHRLLSQSQTGPVCLHHIRHAMPWPWWRAYLKVAHTHTTRWLTAGLVSPLNHPMMVYWGMLPGLC
jgi:hypothetical protein